MEIKHLSAKSHKFDNRQVGACSEKNYWDTYSDFSSSTDVRWQPHSV